MVVVRIVQFFILELLVEFLVSVEEFEIFITRHGLLQARLSMSTSDSGFYLVGPP